MQLLTTAHSQDPHTVMPFKLWCLQVEPEGNFPNLLPHPVFTPPRTQVRVCTYTHTHTHICKYSQRDSPPLTPQSIFKTQLWMRKQSPFLSLNSNLLYQFWSWEVPDQSQQIWSEHSSWFTDGCLLSVLT